LPREPLRSLAQIWWSQIAPGIHWTTIMK
jgi:hypothetical protein